MYSSLISVYYKLLQEYDKILGLTDKLLQSLKSEEDEDSINSLLDERLKSLQKIQKMTKNLSDFDPFPEIQLRTNYRKANLKIIAQLKSLHRNLEEKTSVLQEKEKELEKLAEDIN